MGKDPIGNLKIGSMNLPLSYVAWIVVIVVLFGGMGLGARLKDLNIGDLWGAPSDENFVGGVAWAIDEADWQANIAAVPTTPAFSLYFTMPSGVSVGKPIAVGGSTISVDGSGFVWIDMYGGTDFYLIPDYAVLKSVNPRARDLVISDYDNDGSLDYMVKFDVGDIGVTGQGINPTMDITLPLLDQDTGGLAISAPADQTGLGEAEVVATITHTLSGLAADDGYMISEIWYTTNATTEGDRVAFEELSFSGGVTAKKITGAAMSDISKINSPIKEENGNYNAWYILADEDNDPLSKGGLFVYRATDETDDLALKINVRCTFATNNKVSITAHVRYVTPAGVKADLTDTISLEEA